jgi:regulator of sigma E protease
MIWTILLFLALLSVLVLGHELGHFIAARKAGMKVDEFGLGFPPRLWAWKRKSGMEISVNMIPLGGFVKIKGEGGDDDVAATDSFASKSIPRRFVVLIAGVAMNFVMAFVIFTVGFLVGIPAVTDTAPSNSPIAGGEFTVTNEGVTVFEVLKDSPAEVAGIQLGDKIGSIDDAVYMDSEAARVALAPGMTHEVVLQRGGEEVTVQVTPSYIESIGHEAVGISLLKTGTVHFPWYEAPWRGIKQTVASTGDIFAALGGLIANIFTHKSVGAAVSGPIGIAVVTGQVAKMGFAHILQFAAMLSLNLAVLNVLPIPALDGGRIGFLLIEAIRRKKGSVRFESTVHALGFALLMLLVVFVTFKDILGLVK